MSVRTQLAGVVTLCPLGALVKGSVDFEDFEDFEDIDGSNCIRNPIAVRSSCLGRLRGLAQGCRRNCCRHSYATPPHDGVARPQPPDAATSREPPAGALVRLAAAMAAVRLVEAEKHLRHI